MSEIVKNVAALGVGALQDSVQFACQVTSDRMRQTTGRGEGDDEVIRLIEEGIADGSVRPDLDPRWFLPRSGTC